MSDDKQRIFTVRQVATICKVAPKTVIKWFDSGRLKGHRLPCGGCQRRIPREYLIKFLTDHGMPLGELDDNPEGAFTMACRKALEHVVELREAWRVGAITESDGQGGTRSNRNVEVEGLLRAALGQPSSLANHRER